jgi:MYXO-CTERM domain-containing protein
MPTDSGMKNLADVLAPEDMMTTKSDGGDDVDPLPPLPGGSRSGCGCHVPGTSSSRAPWSLMALAFGAALARRRRS